MSLVRIAGMKRKASVDKIKIVPGFTKAPYFQWLSKSFGKELEDGALLKKGAWEGGLEVISPNGRGCARLGAAFLGDTGQTFALSRSGPAHATGYLVVPVTDRELGLLSDGKSVSVSYPEVLYGVPGYNEHCFKDMVSRYMKRGGCRATKYVMCSYSLLPHLPYQGMFDPYSILNQVYRLLLCLGGSEKAVVKDADFVLDDNLVSLKEEALSAHAEMVRGTKGGWMGVWDNNVYLPSIFSRGLSLSGDSLREHSVPLSMRTWDINYVDVSKGGIEFKYFPR
jgi:hypothetical protein